MEFNLVIGNHDILDPLLFKKNSIEVSDQKTIGPFLFTHHPNQASAYNLAGHIHPGVRLVDKGKQSLRLPCFFFGDRHGLLPAFGTFTGTSLIKPKIGDRVFVITEDQIAEVT